MEELENETLSIKNKKQANLKPLAFEVLKDSNVKDNQLENLSNENSKSDSLSYNDLDFALAREFSGLIREDNPIRLLTTKIITLYKNCQSDYIFEEIEKPKRELTIPSEGVYNDNLDNVEHDLIVCMDDLIKGPIYQYTVIDILGSGISGQVFKCKRSEDEKLFAMKIIKNKKAHNCQALIELRILEFLNNKVDINDCYHIIRKFDHFYYKNHLCIVFELLNENLYELLKQNYFQGLSLNSIRFILKQILEALLQLQKADLIHCDLKPENILLKIEKEKESKHEILIKVTDFGSACFKDNTFFTYIQSRYYRAPETIIGYPYSVEIDMWSLGCIAAELYLGEPLFPGSSEYDQLSKIINFIEDLPLHMLKVGKNTKKYYNLKLEKDESGKVIETRYELKLAEEFFNENPKIEKPKYSIPSGLSCLDDILKLHQLQSKKNLNQSNTSVSASDLQISINNINNPNNNNLNSTILNHSNILGNNHHCTQNDLEAFVHFLKGLLTIDPKKRWNAKTALRHPFILKEKFDGKFQVEQNDQVSLFVNNETFDINNNSVVSDNGFNIYNNQQQRFFNPNFGNYINNSNKNINDFNPNINQANNYNICLNGSPNFNSNNNFYANFTNANLYNNIGGNNNNNFNINNNPRFLNVKPNNNNLGFPNNNCYNYNNNKNFNCQSMIMNYAIPSSNDNSSLNSNSFNNHLINSSMDYSCYQPNICNIPLNVLKNFPYAKIDEIDLKNSNKKLQTKNKNKNNNFNSKNKNNYNKNKWNKNNPNNQGNNQNQTFTMDDFNKLGNHSFTTENFNFNSNASNNYNNNNNFVNSNVNNVCSNFANMNLRNNYQMNLLNTSTDNRSSRGNINNNNNLHLNNNNNNLLNNSYSNMQNKEDITNTSGNLSKNLISTPSRFNQNLNNSYNLNLSYNSNQANVNNQNYNLNSNNQLFPIEKRTSDQGYGNLSYLKNNDNNSSLSYKEYDDLKSVNDNLNNRYQNNKEFRGRSYSDYYENNKISKNNFKTKNSFPNDYNTNYNFQNYGQAGPNKFHSSQNNYAYFNRNLNNMQNNSQKFNNKKNKKNMSSQNTPIVNNKSQFYDDVSNRSDMFFSTEEIKEEMDEEINQNNNYNLNLNQNDAIDKIEESNND